MRGSGHWPSKFGPSKLKLSYLGGLGVMMMMKNMDGVSINDG